MSLPNQSGMTAPPGLGMPPGLNFPNTSGSSANVNGIPPQPDLSSIGPHTSSAQLAALLANVGNGPDLNPFASQPQQQNAGFNNNFGSFGNNNFNNNNNQAPTGTCRMHQQGHCRYGATCRFAHVGPAGGGGGNSFGNQNNNNFGGNNFGRNQAFGNNQNNNNFGGMNNNFMRGGMNVQQSSLLQPQGVSNSQNDHDKLDASQVGAFNANAATFNPAQNAAANNAAPSVAAPAPLAAAAAAVGGNNALLQALLMQQQLNAASGLPPNPDLDNLIKSLAAPAVPAVTAPTQPATTASNNSNNSDANLNNEFLAAQAQLASLALGGSSSNSNNNNSRPMQNNFNGPSSMNFNQQHNTPFGNNNNNNSNNRFGNQGGFNKFGNNNNMHGHNSHFGGGNFPSAQHGVNQYRDQFNNNYLPGNAPGHVRFHSDANNRDFRREAEIFGPAHSQTTGINFDKYDDIPVEVTGNDIPGEMKAFTDFDFPDVIRQNIELCKYQKPTPIQKFALPVAFLGRDLMACAQTGSGKTAAFLLPFIAHLVINGRPAPQGGNGRNRKYMPVGLILAPTRELATQIWDESLKFVYGTSIHTVVVYGGQDIRQQFRELDRGCDIIIGTPGRLMDFLERGRISLAQISYLCLDEADRMLDMGFEPQIRNIVMQQDMSEQRQTLLFSATFPKEIQRLAGDFMFNYVFIAVGRVGSSSDFITQSVDWVPEEDKRTQLMKYLPTFKGLTLIFVERKKSADLLETYLNREGFHAASIHGDRSQHERETALAMFRNGRCPILVATDVAARGLDIPTLSNVVNFDMPTSIDDYVHRIGRTGRAGNSGNAWSFVNEKSSHLFKELYEMLHENKQVVPQWLAQVVESRGHNRQSGGGKKFGGRDYRAGGYGNHKGGRGGMAQHNLGKRFAQNNNNNNQNQMQGMMNFQQGGNQGNMFPSSSSNAGGFQGNVMRPNQPAQGNFNLAAAMTGRTFPAGPQ